MRKRKAAPSVSPLKQTRVSAFFNRGDAANKRVCGESNKNAESPEIIFCKTDEINSPDIVCCTPPEKIQSSARKSLKYWGDGAAKNSQTFSGSSSETTGSQKENESKNTFQYTSPKKADKPSTVLKKSPKANSKSPGKMGLSKNRSIFEMLSPSKDETNKVLPKEIYLPDKCQNSEDSSKSCFNSAKKNVIDKTKSPISKNKSPCKQLKNRTIFEMLSPSKDDTNKILQKEIYLPDKCQNSEASSKSCLNSAKKNVIDKTKSPCKQLKNRTIFEMLSPSKDDTNKILQKEIYLPDKCQNSEDSSKSCLNSAKKNVIDKTKSPISKSKSPCKSLKNRNIFEMLSPKKNEECKENEKKVLHSPIFKTDTLNLKMSGELDLNVDSAFFGSSPLSQEKQRGLDSPRKCLPELNNDNFDNFEEDFDIDWDSEKKDDLQSNTLRFDPGVLCEVIRSEVVSVSKAEQILNVRSKETCETGCCTLRDMWALNITFSPGDSLFILARFNGKNWIVDALTGYVCLSPNILISSTSLVSAMFCQRRGVLSNFFKGFDSDNKIMVIGKLVHELLQKSLELSPCTDENINSLIEDLLKNPINLRDLYSCDLSLATIKIELDHYIPFIRNFLDVYVTKSKQAIGSNFKGVITDILDIEEDISSFNLGLKGRIDVTVRVNVNGVSKKMPLELKTGRASFSAEHKSQVFLYTMMLSDIGEKIESGLLLYIKEGIMEEIKPAHSQIRDLILLRNYFSQYIRRFEWNLLPEPIRFEKACRKCPYQTICSAFLTDETPTSHPIRTLEISFEPSHLAYFKKWIDLLIIEDAHGLEENDNKLTGLTLKDGFTRLKNEYKYTFLRNTDPTTLRSGNFVVLSTKEKNYTGRIIHLSSKMCSIAFDKQLPTNSDCYSVTGFRSSMLIKYLTNLGEFMEESHKDLREIIIEKRCANINEKFPKSLLTNECLKILGTLNEDQQRAVLKVLATNDYLLIEGPPGTGKTQTIVALLRIFVAQKRSVLLVGHTHSSIDNVLLRLSDIDFLRLGNSSSIHEAIVSKSYNTLSQNVKSIEDIEKLFDKPILASTCLGLDSDIVFKKKFDACIVDESSQVLQPEALKPLFASKKFVLIGDPKQLRPVVKSEQAKQLGMDESIFETLYNDSSFVSLTLQYRMNKTIMALANALTYNNKLKAGSSDVDGRTMHFNHEKITEEWLNVVLSCTLESSVVFIDIGDYLTVHPNENFSCVNIIEANMTKKIIETLLEGGVASNDVGVMAPYRAQIQKLAEIMPIGVEVNTVDQYQGRDKDIIIYSCTKMNRIIGERREHEILNDHRRFTVSVTRAKCKLIIIGDKQTLVNYKTFKQLFEYLKDDNILFVKEGLLDFSWKHFLP